MRNNHLFNCNGFSPLYSNHLWKSRFIFSCVSFSLTIIYTISAVQASSGTSTGGGYIFNNFAGWLVDSFCGSKDGFFSGSGAGFDGSGAGFSGSEEGFSGSGEAGGWIGNKNGIGGQAMFYRPSGLIVASDGTIYVSDTGNNVIRKITPNGEVTKLAGNFLGSADGSFLGSGDGVFAGSADGSGGDAQFKNPHGLSIDKEGNIIVADRKNHAIRKVSSNGVVSTIAGGFSGSGTTGVSGSSDGPALADGSADGNGGLFSFPSDIVVDASGVIYVADSGNHAIRKIDSSGNVTTLAGKLGAPGSANAAGTAARFNSPQGIAIDRNGNIVVADTTNGLIRKVTPTGVVSTIAGMVFQKNSGAEFVGSAGEAFTGSSGEGGALWVCSSCKGFLHGKCGNAHRVGRQILWFK